VYITKYAIRVVRTIVHLKVILHCAPPGSGGLEPQPSPQGVEPEVRGSPLESAKAEAARKLDAIKKDIRAVIGE